MALMLVGFYLSGCGYVDVVATPSLFFSLALLCVGQTGSQLAAILTDLLVTPPQPWVYGIWVLYMWVQTRSVMK